ncbi:MAG: prepilin-type N-terminal cleavage/methylation domain-containing protein [Candidatus Korobacteraceae bacterium]
MRKQQGFSLVELLLVVAVILILSAIAVPNIMRARIAANETSAIASLRNIATAQAAYAETYPELGFAPDLNTLGPGPVAGNTTSNSTNALLLDNVLGCPAGVGTAYCEKSGYDFNITAATGTPLNVYSANGNPAAPGQSGTRYFYTDNSSVIRFNSTTIASGTDQAIQ